MRYLVYFGSFVFLVCVLVLASMSDIDELGLIEQAKQEQRDRIQHQISTNEAYRLFYTQKPTGGVYVSSHL